MKVLADSSNALIKIEAVLYPQDDGRFRASIGSLLAAGAALQDFSSFMIGSSARSPSRHSEEHRRIFIIFNHRIAT